MNINNLRIAQLSGPAGRNQEFRNSFGFTLYSPLGTRICYDVSRDLALRSTFGEGVSSCPVRLSAPPALEVRVPFPSAANPRHSTLDARELSTVTGRVTLCHGKCLGSNRKNRPCLPCLSRCHGQKPLEGCPSEVGLPRPGRTSPRRTNPRLFAAIRGMSVRMHPELMRDSLS